MGLTYELKILAFCILPALAAGGRCPGIGGCKVRQIGSPQYALEFLQCSGDSCQNATFAPFPSSVCIIRYPSSNSDESTVRIYLRSCVNLGDSDGYFLDGEGSIVTSKQGITSQNTLFTDTSCETYCGTIESVMYRSNGKMLIADKKRIRTSRTASCTQAFPIYPNVVDVVECNQNTPMTNAALTAALPVQGLPPRRQCNSRTSQGAVLAITDGTNAVAVGSPVRLSNGSYRLPIVDWRNSQLFFIQGYYSQAVGANGTIERVKAYTLQLIGSNKFLVADVLDDTSLNIKAPGSTGLNLEDASKFSDGCAKEPDYRFFVRYRVTISTGAATVFCPLFHRNYCLYPGVSGYLRLTPVKTADRSSEPTFVNPTGDVLRNFVQNSRPTTSSTLWHLSLRV